MVARFYIIDVGADLLDHTSRFMAEHCRQRMWIKPFHEVQIRVAEAGDRGADQDFARARVGQADVLDHQRLVDFVQDGGLHRILPKILLVFLNQNLSRAQAYAAMSKSPTSDMPTARSPSRWLVTARCTEFSVSRNGSPGETR